MQHFKSVFLIGLIILRQSIIQKDILSLKRTQKAAEIKNNAKFLLQDVLRNSENGRLFYARRKWVSISISLE